MEDVLHGLALGNINSVVTCTRSQILMLDLNSIHQENILFSGVSCNWCISLDIA